MNIELNDTSVADLKVQPAIVELDDAQLSAAAGGRGAANGKVGEIPVVTG